MSREQLHQKISDLLEMLNVNNNRLSLHEEKLSQLDIDVLRKQCIDLYDTVNRLALEGKRSTAVKQPKAEVKVEKPEVEPVVEAIKQPEPIVQKEEPVQEVVSEVKEVEEVKVVVEKAPPPPVKKIKKKSKEEDEEPRSIHKKLQDEQEMVSLFEKFNSKPIESISKAINISKRFEFQNNLFEGDGKQYKGFIEKIEEAGDRESAFEVYHEYKNRLEWTNEDLKDELKSLLYRKYHD